MADFDAASFGREWEAAWNRRDVEAVLKHFHPDAVFASPIAKQIGFSDGGVVKGKSALRRYWTAALLQNPDLRFQVTKVYQGIESIVIAYQNQHRLDRVEVLFFKDGLVIEGRGMMVTG